MWTIKHETTGNIAGSVCVKIGFKQVCGIGLMTGERVTGELDCPDCGRADKKVCKKAC